MTLKDKQKELRQRLEQRRAKFKTLCDGGVLAESGEMQAEPDYSTFDEEGAQKLLTVLEVHCEIFQTFTSSFFCLFFQFFDHKVINCYLEQNYPLTQSETLPVTLETLLTKCCKADEGQSAVLKNSLCKLSYQQLITVNYTQGTKVTAIETKKVCLFKPLYRRTLLSIKIVHVLYNAMLSIFFQVDFNTTKKYPFYKDPYLNTFSSPFCLFLLLFFLAALGQ